MGKVYKIKNLRTGEEKEFVLSPPVPLVRRRLFKFFKRIIEELPEETIEHLRQKKVDITNPLKIIIEFIDYLVDSDQIEEFVACIICPVEMTEREHDAHLDEIKEFLEENIPLALEVKIIWDFFTDTSIEDIIAILQSIKSEMRQRQKTMNLKPSGTSG